MIILLIYIITWVFTKQLCRAGIRVIGDKDKTDIVEANAFGHLNDKIDIYSSSWGPEDSGKEVGTLGRLALRAVKRGISKV